MYKLWWMGPLRDEAGDGTGAGGGTGTSGAGTGTSGGFDAAAFKTEIMGEFNRALNGALKGLKNDFTKLVQSSRSEGDGQGGEGTGSGTGTSDTSDTHKTQPDAKSRALETEMKKLRERLDSETKARETAETARRNSERDRQVQQALAGYQFADASAAKDAFEIHRGAVKWSEDGAALLGPDDQSLEDWIKGSMSNRKYLLAPEPASGAGARPGGKTGSRKFTLEDIDNISKLSAEDQQKLRQDVAAQMGNAMAGR